MTDVAEPGGRPLVLSTERCNEQPVVAQENMSTSGQQTHPIVSAPKGVDSDDEMEEEAPLPLGPPEHPHVVNSSAYTETIFSTLPGSTAHNIQVIETPYNRPVKGRQLPAEIETADAPHGPHRGKAVVPSTNGPHHNPRSSASASPTHDIRMGEKRTLVHPEINAGPPKRVKSGNISYGFSQEEPVSQDPAIQLREERKQFMIENSRSRVQLEREEIFRLFKSTYPEYEGDMKHFQGVCKIIDKQEKAENMDHSLLWDDFIIQHKLRYIPYVEGCMDEIEAGGELLSYLRFWRQKVESPRPLKRIMSLDTIHAVISEQENVS